MDLNTCDIADGMILSGHLDGGEVPYLVRQSGDPGTMVNGPAYTVEFAAADDPRPAVSSHYIDSVPSGAILVIATSPNCQLDVAPYTNISQSLYGGLMSTRAQFLGAHGTVVLGKVRDVKEHQTLGYPVFSYGFGSCPANKTTKVVSVNKPLQIERSGNVKSRVINPGDIVYADSNGVVVVGSGEVAEVLKKAALRFKANELTSQDLRDGKNCQEAQKARRKEFI